MPHTADARYDIIALDLDGTLIGADGLVSQANRDAVQAARDAGIEVVICTGRGFKESADHVRAVDAHLPARGRAVAPMITSGGAMTVDAATGSTLQRTPVRHDIVTRLCALFASMNRAPLLLKDADAAGFDYLVIETGPIEPPTKWWFDNMPVSVRAIPHIDHDEHPEHTVRVGFAADKDTMRTLATAVREQFEAEVLIHSFPAVSGAHPDEEDSPFAEGRPQGVAAGIKVDAVHLLEVFDARVSKWSALHALAESQNVPPERVAAVGDEINDLAMIQGAGLGVAMGNAIPEVKAAAQRHTESHAEDGVARAIERILRAEW